MDDRLRILQYLYGEDVDDPTFADRLADDTDLQHEFDTLQETKARLDRRPSPSPDSEVVDRVVDMARAAASDGSSTSSPAGDRSARPPSRAWSKRLQTASAALALVLVVGLTWWQLPEASQTSPSGVSAADVQSSSSDPAVPGALEGQTVDADAIPAWDERDELVRIHHRIERLQARSTSDGWESLQTVGQTRP